MSVYSIIGGNGFIGRSLVNYLERLGNEVHIYSRHNRPKIGDNLGRVIYCAGTTSDFRSRLYDTVDAHVTTLLQYTKQYGYESFTYLSSTRVYLNNIDTSESEKIKVNSNIDEEIFGLSKLLGESICINGGEKFKVVRVSNVVGNDHESNNFIYSVFKEIISHKKLLLMTKLESSKDYIAIDDVIQMVVKIANSKNFGIYNLASGMNLDNLSILNVARKFINFEVEVDHKSRCLIFPRIDITRIRREFSFSPKDIEVEIEKVFCDLYLRFSSNNVEKR